jgi:Na+-driven multidrug efflux pump
MLIIRFLIVIVTLLLVASGGMYLFTRDDRYMRFAWQVLRLTGFLLFVVALLFVLERYVLVGWRILL